MARIVEKMGNMAKLSDGSVVVLKRWMTLRRVGDDMDAPRNLEEELFDRWTVLVHDGTEEGGSEDVAVFLDGFTGLAVDTPRHFQGDSGMGYVGDPDADRLVLWDPDYGSRAQDDYNEIVHGDFGSIEDFIRYVDFSYDFWTNDADAPWEIVKK